MKDPRIEKLADVLIQHSTRLQKGENVLIEAIDIPDTLVIALVRKAAAIGANPLVTLKQNTILRELYTHLDESGIQLVGELEAARMQKMQAYIGIRGSQNINELSDVPEAGMKRYQKFWWQPVHLDIRVPKTKWVVLRYPNASMAQLSQQSTEAFEDFYFNVCTLDYSKMSRAMDALKTRMESADQVHLTGPGTDLRFSIKNIGAVKCDGSHNIPDGEVYSAPVKDSVEGVIAYNTRSIYLGTTFQDLKFEFKQGKIVNAEANNTTRLNEILETDEGARYVGEFALGVNPYILKPMLDTLFDEKIAGSFHFTPGAAYDKTDNGNRSQVHWDLVNIQRPEYGGGEIWFDGELIRKDGLFVPVDLLPLNPENLK